MKQDSTAAQDTNNSPKDGQDGSVQPLFDANDNHGHNLYQKQPSEELPHFDAQGGIQGRPDENSCSCDADHSDKNEEETCSCSDSNESENPGNTLNNQIYNEQIAPTYSAPNNMLGNAPNNPPYSAPSHTAGNAPSNSSYSIPSHLAGNAPSNPPYSIPSHPAPGGAPSNPSYSSPNNLDAGCLGSVDQNMGNQAPPYAGQSKPFISQQHAPYPPNFMQGFHQPPPFYAFNPMRPGTYQAPPAFSQSYYPHGYPGQSDGYKVPKHDENRYGKMVEVVNGVLGGNPDIPKMVELIESWDQSFWKGAAVGAGLTLLLTSSTFKTAIANLLSGAAEEAKK